MQNNSEQTENEENAHIFDINDLTITSDKTKSNDIRATLALNLRPAVNNVNWKDPVYMAATTQAENVSFLPVLDDQVFIRSSLTDFKSNLTLNEPENKPQFMESLKTYHSKGVQLTSIDMDLKNMKHCTRINETTNQVICQAEYTCGETSLIDNFDSSEYYPYSTNIEKTHYQKKSVETREDLLRQLTDEQLEQLLMERRMKQQAEIVHDENVQEDVTKVYRTRFTLMQTTEDQENSGTPVQSRFDFSTNLKIQKNQDSHYHYGNSPQEIVKQASNLALSLPDEKKNVSKFSTQNVETSTVSVYESQAKDSHFFSEFNYSKINNFEDKLSSNSTQMQQDGLKNHSASKSEFKFVTVDKFAVGTHSEAVKAENACPLTTQDTTANTESRALAELNRKRKKNEVAYEPVIDPNQSKSKLIKRPSTVPKLNVELDNYVAKTLAKTEEQHRAEQASSQNTTKKVESSEILKVQAKLTEPSFKNFVPEFKMPESRIDMLRSNPHEKERPSIQDPIIEYQNCNTLPDGLFSIEGPLCNSTGDDGSLLYDDSIDGANHKLYPLKQSEVYKNVSSFYSLLVAITNTAHSNLKPEVTRRINNKVEAAEAYIDENLTTYDDFYKLISDFTWLIEVSDKII